MNSTNDTEAQSSYSIDNNTRIITGVAIALQIVIALLALGGNSCIVAVYLKFKALQDSTSPFIINLGFTDLLTGFALFAVLALEPTGLRQKNYIACLGSSVFIQYLTLASHSLILVTTFEKYIGICKRESYNKLMTKRIKMGLIICSWVLPFPMSCLPLFGFNNWEDVGCVFPQIYPKWTLTLRTAFHFFQMGISFVFYVRILLKVRELQQEVRPGPMQGINASTTRYNSIRKSIKNGRIIALVTIIFFASWLPYNISIIVYCCADIWAGKALSSCFKLFGLANSMINPFLYAWQKRDIRSRLEAMLKCKKDTRIFSSDEITPPRTHRHETATKSIFCDSKESMETSSRCIRHINTHASSNVIETMVEKENVVFLKSSFSLYQVSEL